MFGDKFGSQCQLICWGVGLVLGIVTLFTVIGQVGFFAALLLGIALGAFIGLVLQQLFCTGEKANLGQMEENAGRAPGAAAASAPAAAAPVATSAGTPVAGGTAAAAEPEAQTASGGTDAASAVDPTFTSGTTDAEAGAKAGGEGSGSGAPAKAKTETKAKAPKASKTAPEGAKGGETDGENEGAKPEGLDGPRGGKADNLKEIKGVGPKLENLLHAMGFYHFDQIASWSADEVAWVDANLKGFKGRVSRDNWIDQAKTLAAGGETDFSKRVDKGDVY